MGILEPSAGVHRLEHAVDGGRVELSQLDRPEVLAQRRLAIARPIVDSPGQQGHASPGRAEIQACLEQCVTARSTGR